MAQVDVTGNVVSAPLAPPSVPTIDFTSQPNAPTQQFPAQAPPQDVGWVSPPIQPWQTENRITYLNAMKQQISDQQAQAAQAEWARIQQMLNIAQNLPSRLTRAAEAGTAAEAGFNSTSLYEAANLRSRAAQGDQQAQQQFAQLAQANPDLARQAVLAVQQRENVTGQGPFGSMNPAVSAALGLAGAGGLTALGALGAVRLGASALAPEAAQPITSRLPGPLQTPVNLGVGIASGLVGGTGSPAQQAAFTSTFAPSVPGQVGEFARHPSVETAIPLAMLAAPFIGPKLIEGAKAAGMTAEDFLKTPMAQRIINEERGSVGTPPEPPQPPAEAKAEGVGAPAPASPPSPEPGSAEAAIAALNERRKNLTMAIRQLQGPKAVKQPIADVLPPLYNKAIVAMQEATLAPKERASILGAARSKQAGSISDILQGGGTTLEKARAARGAEKGRIIPAIQPSAAKFNADEIDQLFGAVENAAKSGQLTPHEFPNAVDAMNLWLYGTRLDPESKLPLNLMPGEIKMLGRVFGPEFADAIPRTPQQFSKWQNVVDAVALPRAIKAAFDVSAPGRQGAILGARNPVEWLKAWGPMLKSMRSDEGFNTVGESIRKMPSFISGQEHGLRITDVGGGAGAEESFVSRFADQIPGLNASDRGYVAYLNYLRQTVYEKGWNRLNALADRQTWTSDRLSGALDDWASFVNHASGQGDLGLLKPHLATLNAAFFSPKYFISRPQAVWDLVRPGMDPAVRTMVGENLGAFAAMAVSALTALKMTGAAQVELDPRSTDWGKARIGDQRIEFLAGAQPIVRNIAQFATAARKNDITGQIQHAKRSDVLTRFIRSKLSPAGAMAFDLTAGGGKTFTGQDIQTNIPSYLLDQVAPLVLQDAVEAYMQQGPMGLLRGVPASAVGLGVQTYQPSQTAQGEASKVQLQSTLDKAGFGKDAQQAWANPQWQNAFASDLGTSVSNYKSIDDLKTAYIAEVAPQLAKSQNIPLKVAQADAANGFERFPTVKAWRKEETASELTFWRQYPQLLRQALDLGLTSPSAEKTKILQGAP